MSEPKPTYNMKEILDSVFWNDGKGVSGEPADFAIDDNYGYEPFVRLEIPDSDGAYFWLNDFDLEQMWDALAAYKAKAR